MVVRVGDDPSHGSATGVVAARLDDGVISGARVLVLYVNPLVGEGLVRLLKQDSRLDVQGIIQADSVALDGALAAGPAVVVLEDGGPVGLRDLVHRPNCQRVIDISAITSECWILNIERVRAGADAGRELADACLGRTPVAVPVEVG